jgi:hypothetical protein
MAWKEPSVEVLDLSYQRQLTVAIGCGWCWVNLPSSEVVLLALVTRRHMESVIDDPHFDLVFRLTDDEASLYNFLEEPQLPTPEDVEYPIDDPHHFELVTPFTEYEASRFDFFAEPQFPTPEDFAAHIVEVGKPMARIFRVVKDPKPVREHDVREEIEDLRPHLSPEVRESDITDAIGPRYSSRSEGRGRLGMIEVTDYDEAGRCNAECRRCGTVFAVGRIEAARATAHVYRFGGVCYATAEVLVVYGSKKPYRSLSS